MRPSLFQGLRPFLRREWRTRLVTALVAVFVLTGLTGLGVMALTRLDTREAHALRVDLGLEHPYAVCGAPGASPCTYDDRVQAEHDRELAWARSLRSAILTELHDRIVFSQAELAAAQVPQGHASWPSSSDDAASWATLSSAVVDLRPAPVPSVEARRRSLRHAFDRSRAESSMAALDQAIGFERRMLDGVMDDLHTLAARDGLRLDGPRATRVSLEGSAVAEEPWSDWLPARGSLPELARLARTNPAELGDMVTRRSAARWADGWTTAGATGEPLDPPPARYRSPMAFTQRAALLGSVWLGLGACFLLVVGPVVTATQTAREGEAGTLPVLRMTGRTARELAAAMVLGPNLLAHAVGVTLVALSLPFCVVGGTASAWMTATTLLLVTSITTHVFAVGWADALGRRMSAMFVGGITTILLVVPGILGTLMLVRDIAATGLLLGPLPAVFTATLTTSGLPLPIDVVEGGSSTHGATMLAYVLLAQGVVAWAFLQSWKRRVERPWAPLFRTSEALLLTLACLGCTALALVDLSERVHAQSHRDVNVVTALACGFMLPVLAGLFTTSLARPARDGAVVALREARRAFWRYQGFLLAAASTLGIAYIVALHHAGLHTGPSEPMVATLAQVLLVAECVAATLLWGAQCTGARRSRIFVFGATLLVLELGTIAAMYAREVEHVMLRQGLADPFSLALEASPSMLAFLVLLWAAGFGLILAALLRERDHAEAEQEVTVDEEGDDESEETPPRWLH